MLVRYRMNASCTLANMQSDFNNIILGNITSVNQLSAGCDQVNTVIYGSYPTGTPYARVNGSTFTYSKTHNDSTTSKTHYFRLNFDATKLTTIQLAQSYTSGTDTLVNGYTGSALNLVPIKYDANIGNGIDIVVNSKLIALLGQGQTVTILDLGHNNTTRTYANSMLMMYQDLGTNSIPQWGPNGITLNATTGGVVPYTYLYSTSAYGTLSASLSAPLVTRISGGNGITILSENPLFYIAQGATNLMYGAYRLPYATFNGVQIYKDTLNAYRITINDVSLLVD